MLNSSEDRWGRCPVECDGQILDPFSDTNRAKEVFKEYPFFQSYEIFNLIFVCRIHIIGCPIYTFSLLCGVTASLMILLKMVCQHLTEESECF